MKLQRSMVVAAFLVTSVSGFGQDADKLLEQRQLAANFADIKAALTKRLRDPTASNRVYAAEALWRIDNDPAALAALTAALKDNDRGPFEFLPSHVMQNAYEALDSIGVGAKAAVPALLEALNDGWVWERKYAAWAESVCTASGCRAGAGAPPARLPPADAAWLLWRIDKHPAVMPALLNALKDPVHRSGAARTLGRIGVEAKEAVPLLLKLLDEENGAARSDVAKEGPLTRYREALTYALWQINKHPAYIPALVEGLKDKNPSMRIYYINALGRIGAEAHAAVPALADALNDDKELVALAAAEALGRIGADAAVPALLEALKYWGRMRVAAAEALWQINKHPRAVPVLAAALTDQTDYTNNYAYSALHRIGAEAKAAAPAFAKMLKDKNVEWRVTAAGALWTINKDPAVVPVLVDVLKDMKAPSHTRVFAAKALWRINKHPGAVPALIEILRDEKSIYAAEALWQINKHPAYIRALIERMEESKSNADYGGIVTLGHIGAELQASLAQIKKEDAK